MTRVISAYEKIPETTATKETTPIGGNFAIGTTEEQPLVVKYVRQVSKKPRISQEFRINAQIGDYDIENIVIDLGLDVNVMPKRTWEVMGKN